MSAKKEDFVEDIMRALSSIVYPMRGGVCIGCNEVDGSKVNFYVHDRPCEQLEKLSNVGTENTKVFDITFDLKDIDYNNQYSVLKAKSTVVNELQCELIKEIKDEDFDISKG